MKPTRRSGATKCLSTARLGELVTPLSKAVLDRLLANRRSGVETSMILSSRLSFRTQGD